MNRACALCALAVLLAACSDPVGEVVQEFAFEVDGTLAADRLTEEAGQVVTLAPEWLVPDLVDSLAHCGPGTQRKVAVVFLEAEARYRDEIAFVIAHAARGELRSDMFDAGLLVQNAELIYQRAEELPYVELVEAGDPERGGDYYTTAQYRFGDGWHEIPREIYYWYLVHPRLEDERPIYLDPIANATSPPPNGRFWREYLYSAADEVCPDALHCPDDPFSDGHACPRLADMLAGESLLWKRRHNDCADNGAVGAVCRWVLGSMCFGAGAERPNQPARIYHLHRGNCGEYADLTGAALRSALIPAVNVAAYGNDHTWNQFWADGWHQFEPVNGMVDDFQAYDRDADVPGGWWWLLGTYFARGDGSVEVDTQAYSDLIATVEAEVSDPDGQPVEGAQVVAGTYKAGFVATGLGLTDAAGRVSLPIGDHNDFYMVALSGSGELLDDGPELAIQMSEPNQVYSWAVQTPDRLPALALTRAEPPVGGDYLLEVIPSGGRRFATGHSVVSGMEHAEGRDGAATTVFMADADNLALYESGQAFQAHVHERGYPGGLAISLADPAGWAVVVDQATNPGLASFQRLRVRLSHGNHLLADRSVETYLEAGERLIVRFVPVEPSP